MERNKDYYRILGVPRDASAAAIKRAYRTLAKKLHPDRGLGSSTEEFRQLQAAYETLSDAERRRRYDESLTEPEERRAKTSPPAWSVVRSPAVGDLRRPLRPSGMSGEVLLTAEEAAAGGVMQLDVPLQAMCPSCDGTGGFVFDCPRCDGEGRIQRSFPVPLRIPPGVRNGTVFQVAVDDPSILSVILTIHIRAF